MRPATPQSPDEAVDASGWTLSSGDASWALPPGVARLGAAQPPAFVPTHAALHPHHPLLHAPRIGRRWAAAPQRRTSQMHALTCDIPNVAHHHQTSRTALKHLCRHGPSWGRQRLPYLGPARLQGPQGQPKGGRGAAGRPGARADDGAGRAGPVEREGCGRGRGQQGVSLSTIGTSIRAALRKECAITLVEI
jgi:hypothetical protein